MKTFFRYVFVFAIVWGGVILILDKLVMPKFVQHKPTITVPNFVNKPVEEVVDYAQKAGYRIIQTTIFLPNKPEGIVVDQYPQDGLKVRKGKTLRLKISTQKEYVKMPNLVGKNRTTSELELKQAELDVGSITLIWPDSAFLAQYPKAGVVASQSIKEDSLILKYSIIDLEISEGEWAIELEVPDLINKGIKTAEKLLQKAGLYLGRVHYDVRPNLSAKTVINQSYPPMTKLGIADSIDVVISIESKEKLLKILKEKKK